MVDWKIELEKQQVDELLNRASINGIITTDLSYKPMITIPALCRYCDKIFGNIIVEQDTDHQFECSGCVHEEV